LSRQKGGKGEQEVPVSLCACVEDKKKEKEGPMSITATSIPKKKKGDWPEEEGDALAVESPLFCHECGKRRVVH